MDIHLQREIREVINKGSVDKLAVEEQTLLGKMDLLQHLVVKEMVEQVELVQLLQ